MTLGLLVMALLGSVEKSSAGEYSVKQCAGSQFQDFFGQYRLMGADFVDVVDGCNPGQAAKLGIYQDRRGSWITSGSGGQFLWTAPRGVEIYGTAVTARLNDANNIRASIMGFSDQGAEVLLDEGRAHDGVFRTMRWENRAAPRNLVSARLHCFRAEGCSNASGGPKAYLEVTDLGFKSRDIISPSVEAAGSLPQLGESGAWHRGEVRFLVNATDQGSGVSGSYLLVNGLKLDLGTVICAGAHPTYSASFTPCPPQVGKGGIVETSLAPFQEGQNIFQFCAEDYAAASSESNRTCTNAKTAFIDNIAPAAPEQIETVGGSGWRSTNGFTIRWTNPGGQRSPIVEAEYRVVRTSDGSVVDQGSAAIGASPTLDSLEVPSTGEFEIEVRLKDSVGNTGPPSSTMVRFDDARPGVASPEPQNGWISEDEFPVTQVIGRAQPGGPSGVKGYAVAISDDGPFSPCPSGICQEANLSLSSGPEGRILKIDHLAEGEHWISSVASSGAGLASDSLASTTAKVDRREPTAEISGVPQGWSKDPVTLTATAIDEGSGMVDSPTDDGFPVTVIRAGGSPAFVAPGAVATFTVADQGVTRVSYWARDLAGNVNDGAVTSSGQSHRNPGETTVRIDRLPPEVKVDVLTRPADPEVIKAIVSDGDSGLASGSIQYRKAGQNEPFIELETSRQGDELLARIPSDTLPTGSYEVRALATDVAGNSAYSTDTEPVDRVVLPLKRATEIAVRFADKAARTSKVRLRHGQGVRISGTIKGPGGKGIAGAPLSVDQRFAKGSRSAHRSFGIRADSSGAFSAVLKPGPSRVVQVAFAGTNSERPSVSPDIKLTTRDRIVFRVSPGVLRNGGEARMSGFVRGRGAATPSRGKLVAIQYFDPARRRWRPVEVLRCNRAGRFSYAYRFRTISFAQKILFRAVSLPEAGWPFSPSTSRRRSVIVYPQG